MLLGAAGADLAIALADVEITLAEEPVTQVAVNLKHPFLELLSGNIAIFVGEFGILDFPEKPCGEGIRVGLNQADESVRKHHDRVPPMPPIVSLYLLPDTGRDPSHFHL
jgi:hypothetical protein